MDTMLGMLLLLGFVCLALSAGRTAAANVSEAAKVTTSASPGVDVTIDTSAAEAEFTGPPPGGPVPAFL